jgi:carboxyl-terminal processing protease
MINGGLEHLDSHSAFINQRTYKRFSLTSKGKFGGIGIQIDSDRPNGERYITVATPMVGTPAYEAGVLAGDVILKIDGKSTENIFLNDAIDLITGEPGQKVVLTILHQSAREPVDIEITRAEIEVPSVLGDLRRPEDPKEWDFYIDKPNKIAYLRLINFSENTAADLRHVLDELKKEGLHGLVLDLRTNPGGLLRSAVEVSRLFLPEGRIVSTRGRDQQEEVYEAHGREAILAPAKDYPMAILVNRLSASASEIVAAALQDHSRAVVIGERTYGKGSVQNILEMENHTSALKLTTASYWRPSGKNIHRFPDSKDTDDWGVRPNAGFEVKLSLEEQRDYFRYRRDRDIVREKGGAVPSPTATPDAGHKGDKDRKPFVDRTLEKALDYLRGEIHKVAQG